MNRKLCRRLRIAADMLELRNAPSARVESYREAAHFLQDIDAADLLQDEGGRPAWMSAEIIHAVRCFLKEGRIPVLDELGFDEQLHDLLLVEGIPRKVLVALAAAAGTLSAREALSALEEMDDGSMRLPSRYPPRKLKSRLSAWVNRRYRLGEVLREARKVVNYLRGATGQEKTAICGAVRRGEETTEAVYLLAADPSRVTAETFAGMPGMEDVRRPSAKLVEARYEEIPFLLRTCTEEEFVPLLLHHSASPEHRRKLKRWLRGKGYVLRDDRFGRREGPRIRLEREEDFFRECSLQFIPPELRTGRDEVELAAKGALPELLDAGMLRGDLHVHSSYSDGKSDLEEIAASARRLGHEYVAVCDHSESLRIAGGLPVERMYEKLAAVEVFNERRPGGTLLLCGTEVDILEDGSLDYPMELLRRIPIVVCSLHTGLWLSRRKQTSRVIKAISHPCAVILGHPTARLLEERRGVELEWKAVVDACVEYDVAIEINAHPKRMDPCPELLREAAAAGAKFSIGSDSHHADQMEMVELGIIQARRAALSPDSIINTWPLERLLEWVERKRAGHAGGRLVESVRRSGSGKEADG